MYYNHAWFNGHIFLLTNGITDILTKRECTETKQYFHQLFRTVITSSHSQIVHHFKRNRQDTSSWCSLHKQQHHLECRFLCSNLQTQAKRKRISHLPHKILSKDNNHHLLSYHAIRLHESTDTKFATQH